jgi:protein-S-isoprenylcysteine O-methyltransferase Ste14
VHATGTLRQIEHSDDLGSGDCHFTHTSGAMRLAEILLAWLGYFVLHSWLAASSVKAWIARRWPQLVPGYRIAFNVLAVLTLPPILWLVHDTQSTWLWQWRGAWAWVADAIALLALVCFLASLRAYDMGEFFGLRQLEKYDRDMPGTFTVSPLHRFVRHPWYCIGLVLIWTRDMNEPFLISALAISAYLFIGAKFEDRKLVESYGETYRRYMAAVPGLIPLPWRYLSAKEVAALLSRRR